MRAPTEPVSLWPDLDGPYDRSENMPSAEKSSQNSWKLSNHPARSQCVL